MTLRRAIAGYGFLVASVALAQAAEPVLADIPAAAPEAPAAAAAATAGGGS